MNRGSYRGLMHLPVWRMENDSGELVATVRAQNYFDAAIIFNRHGLRGAIKLQHSKRKAPKK